MAGQLRKDDIIEQKAIQDALAAIAKSVMEVASAFDKVAQSSKSAFESTKKAQTTKDIAKESQESAKNATAQATAEKKLNTEITKTNKLLSEEEKLKKKVAQSTEQLALARSKDNKTLQQNRQRMAEINREFKEQVSKGSSLTQSFRGLMKSVVAYAAAYAGLRAIVRFFTQDLFNLTKELASLEFSMKTIIKDHNEFAVTQDFIRKTAINYGQDIVTLTERYIKFRAATMQSNLSAQETMDIFNSMAKAAGVLGLKTDELNGIFLALEQMVSKGKVTTEELRRQLGERLPGAMGIMADSMGITISQLDKMLKAGEVLSAEVLPNFAKAVERAYGIETVNKIDTLVAAQGRLTTSWKLFVEELNSSNVYSGIIANFTNVFNRMRISFDSIFPKDTGIIENYLLMTTKAGDTVRKFVKQADALSLNVIKSAQAEKMFTKQMEEEGLTVWHVNKIWKEYYNTRVAASEMDKDKYTFSSVFDYETEKKKLEQAEADFKAFSKLANGQLKQEFKDTSPALKVANTEKEYLQKIAVTARGETEIAKVALAEIEKRNIAENIATKLLNKDLDLAERQRLILLQKNLRIESGIRLDNYNDRLAFEVEINNRLHPDGKGGSKKDDSLNILREQQKAEMELMKKQQEDSIRQNNYSEEQLLRVRYQNGQKQLELQLKQNDELLALVKDNALETAKIEADSAKLRAEISKDFTKYLLDEEERRIKELKKLREDEAEDLLSDAEASSHQYYITRLEQAKKEIALSKGNKNEIWRIDNQLTIDLIANRKNRLQLSLVQMDKETKAYADAMAEIAKLDADAEERKNDRLAKSEEIKLDLRQQTFDASKDLLMEGFNFANTLYDRQLQRIQEQHDYEIAAAGDSVEKRIIAERKFEKEKAKIMRKQAIAEKAQAVLGIALNTAAAIISIWAQVPKFDFGVSAGVLTGIVAGIGALQMASALAVPIPKYAKGTKDAPQTFMAGEAGQEAIIKPSGQVVLTPDAPTVFSDKSFVGSTILPADQTQRMLANYAIKQSYDMIDMSESNKTLKQIANNTKNKREVFINSQGRTVIKRGYITSTLV